MKNIILKNIQRWLIEADFDGTHKKVTGWHVDGIDPVLRKRRNLWYPQALVVFAQVLIVKEQFNLPWIMFLVLYLKDRRKYSDVNFYDEKTLKQELHQDTPPEIFLFADEYFNEYLTPLKLSFFSQDLSVQFYKRFDIPSRSYRRSVYFFISRQHVLQLLAADLYGCQTLSLDQARQQVLCYTSSYVHDLESRLYREPHNEQLLTQRGACYLLAGTRQKACYFLRKALEYNTYYGQAYFWLALAHYYSDNSIDAEQILNAALEHNVKDAACMFLLFRIVWERTCSFEYAIEYIYKTIELEPTWVLPRLCLARYFMYKHDHNQAAQELSCARQYLTHDSNFYESLSIVDRYRYTYLIGTLITNSELIDLHEHINTGSKCYYCSSRRRTKTKL